MEISILSEQNRVVKVEGRKLRLIIHEAEDGDLVLTAIDVNNPLAEVIRLLPNGENTALFSTLVP